MSEGAAITPSTPETPAEAAARWFALRRRSADFVEQKQFADWLEAARLTDSRRGRTLSPSWPTMLRWVGIPIDHVAVNDGMTILSHRRLPNFESDHFGALVQVALRGAEQP